MFDEISLKSRDNDNTLLMALSRLDGIISNLRERHELPRWAWLMMIRIDAPRYESAVDAIVAVWLNTIFPPDSCFLVTPQLKVRREVIVQTETLENVSEFVRLVQDHNERVANGVKGPDLEAKIQSSVIQRFNNRVFNARDMDAAAPNGSFLFSNEPTAESPPMEGAAQVLNLLLQESAPQGPMSSPSDVPIKVRLLGKPRSASDARQPEPESVSGHVLLPSLPPWSGESVSAMGYQQIPTLSSPPEVPIKVRLLGRPRSASDAGQPEPESVSGHVLVPSLPHWPGESTGYWHQGSTPSMVSPPGIESASPFIGRAELLQPLSISGHWPHLLSPGSAGPPAFEAGHVSWDPLVGRFAPGRALGRAELWVPDFVVIKVGEDGEPNHVLLIVEDKIYTDPYRQLSGYLALFPVECGIYGLGCRVNPRQGGMEFMLCRRTYDDKDGLAHVERPERSTNQWYPVTSAFIHGKLREISQAHRRPATYHRYDEIVQPDSIS
ncbi:uncharacterized protein BXZ73DRAFT_78355 [Epithele typhae]|uniref:uncharacterized protein n=1 Tax=Epithele typhae TaxID=378194 RepID=UPI002007FD05|nr:uncharacterized protein BXZ73DRAFT_78355 [Epithele typhae]KAH9928558.1 hypothetical protein BXZ73DRAFT_78355 [Epithele typhae]